MEAFPHRFEANDGRSSISRAPMGTGFSAFQVIIENW